jgi:hypothetical protein
MLYLISHMVQKNGIWNMDYDIGNSLRRVQPNVVSNISQCKKIKT